MTEPAGREGGPGPPPGPDLDSYRREGLLEPPAEAGRQVHDGTGRVQLSFVPSDRAVRVPRG